MLKAKDNFFTGSIPSEVGLLTSMEKLWLNDNKGLSGSIPSEVADLTNLAEFLLDDTSITGTLLAELISLPSLEILAVANTLLTGSIPQDLCPVVVDYEFECYTVMEVVEICWERLKPVSFPCERSLLCGCDCGPVCDGTAMNGHTST
jgi:Leucine-rich repeat (LRR) protein